MVKRMSYNGVLGPVVYNDNYTGDLIPGSAGHTLLSSLSNNLFDD